MTQHAVKNTELNLGQKNTRVLVIGQDHACVFLRKQGDSSL